MSLEWCTVESDPGVFTEMIGAFGVKNVEVDEIYSMDVNEQGLQRSYGLVFLFKWKQELESQSREYVDPASIPDLFFARQVVTNACATQAILSVLMNAESVDLGPDLQELKTFTAEFDSETRGMVIGSSEVIRKAHNSFARPEPFVVDNVKFSVKSSEEVYHFVAYVPHRGSVYELDGLKPGPVMLGSFEGDDWISVAKPAVEERMSRYSSTETSFALLSVCDKKLPKLEAKEAELVQQLENGEGEAEENKAHLQAELETVRQEISDEHRKVHQQHRENDRRRHNFVPLIIELLKSLAVKGALKEMYANK